jgi:peptidyl-prolyl cis-trans isomerase D
MLQNIREGIQGPWAIGIVALIVVSFVFSGVGSYISSNNTNAVAIVNGEEIQAGTLENAYNNERARLESQFGEAVNSLFASESYVNQFRNDVLEQLINDELIVQKAKALGLRVGDSDIKKTIATLPEFQIAGVFDNAIYLNALSRAGFTPTEFAEYMRDQMTRQQLVQAINGSNFSLQNQVSQTLALQEQTRDAESLQIDVAKYKESVELTDEDIQAYYSANLSKFDTQEQVKLAYVTLSVADLAPNMTVSDEEVAQYYDDNKALYTSQEIRRVAHILFESSADDGAARIKAEAVLLKVKAGDDFAVLAEENSDDIVSAEEGGDLGEISRGDYEGAFDDAAYALGNVGDVSEIIETDFGLHIIKLTEYTPAVVTPLAQASADIESVLRLSLATDEFFALQQEMARLAFEEPDSLEAVADATNRPIIETDFFEQNRLPGGVNYPQLANVAFSSELVDERVNSDLLELGENLVMVARVVDHKAQRTLALDEVSAQIQTELKIEKAQQQALSYAQEIQSAMLTQEDTTELLAQQALTWSTHLALSRTSNDLPLVMVNAIFELGPVDGANSKVVSVNDNSVGIVLLSAVNTASQDDDNVRKSIEQRIASRQGQQTYANFIAALRESADVQLVKR